MFLQPRDDNFTEKWNTLEKIVKDVLTLDAKDIPKDTWNAVFMDILGLCLSYPKTQANRLFDSTKLILEKHVLQLLHIVQTGCTANQLQNYYTYWQKYRTSVKHLNLLYGYVFLLFTYITLHIKVYNIKLHF